MPTYEYECKSCSHGFEAFQSMSEPALSTCPSCGGEVRRLIHGGTGVIFKGSGFYVNDSKKSSTSSTSKPSKEKESATASESAASATSAAEPAKPEAKKTEGAEPKAPPPKAAEAVK